MDRLLAFAFGYSLTMLPLVRAGLGAEKSGWALLVAGGVAFLLNRWLIGRGMGHAVLHAYHR